MNLIFILPPFFGAVIGAIAGWATFYLLKSKLKEPNSQLEIEFKELFDTHMDELVAGFGRQIPMASLFLNGSIAGKMKLHAKEELLKMTPEIKERLLRKMNSKCLKLSLSAALIGLILGGLQSLFFFLVG